MPGNSRQELPGTESLTQNLPCRLMLYHNREPIWLWQNFRLRPIGTGLVRRNDVLWEDDVLDCAGISMGTSVGLDCVKGMSFGRCQG